MQPYFSIIIPAYNAEKYLFSCVETVLNQSFTNWELIIVNDGSTDTTREVANKLKDTDERITVINQENQGEYASRHSGILKANGTYLLFIDADDIIPTDYLEKIYACKGADILFWGIKEFGAHENINVPSISNEKHIDTDSYLLSVIEDGIYSMCNKAFKKDLFSDFSQLPNPGIRDNEDALMSIRLICRASSFAYVDDVYYMYRIHDESACFTFNPKKLIYLIDTLTYIENLISESGRMTETIHNHFLTFLTEHLNRMLYFLEKTGSRDLECYEYVHSSSLYNESRTNETIKSYGLKNYVLLKAFRFRAYWIIKLGIMLGH